MLPESEDSDSVVDFYWVSYKMQHQGNASASENSERRKLLLQKLNRRKNPLSAIRKTQEGESVTKDMDVIDNDSVRQVESLRCSGGGEARGPDLYDMEDTLKQSCVSHSENQTKYFCNDCTVYICIQCIAFGDHRLHSVCNEKDSRAIVHQMIAERKKEHDIKEMQRFLEAIREEHNEQFETVLKEAINHIRLIQEKALGSWDVKIKALVGVTETSNDPELIKSLHLVKSYTLEKGSVQYSQADNALVIVLPRNPLQEGDPPTDLNAIYPTDKNVQKDISGIENRKHVEIPGSPIASSTPTASLAAHKSSLISKEESARILFVESPEKIFVLRKNSNSDWEEMKSLIEEEALTAKPVIPKKGQTLLCRVGNNKWFRCVIKTVQDSRFKVKLIDVGKSIEVCLRDIRDISRKLKAKESLIDCIKLDVESPGATWPVVTLEKLKEFLPEGEEVYVKDLEDGSRDLFMKTLSVDHPFDPPTLSTKSALSFLVDNGMALKRGTYLRTHFGSRLSANLGADIMDHNKRPIISPKTTTTDDDVDHHMSTCIKMDILPIIPRQQVFEAVMTHVDDNAVVWVVTQDNISKLSVVKASCLKCNKREPNIEVGFMYVARLGKNGVRVRVLKCLEDGTYYAVDVDSGEVLLCDGDSLCKASRQLLHIPPLAVPLKLYGIKKTVDNIGEYIHEDITGPQLGSVTVVVLEDNVKALPMPAHVFYDKNGSKCRGNLAFTMLKKGLVRVITTYDEWSQEFNDHGLEWLLGMSPKLHDLHFLPFPLPLASGTWLSVFVEGFEYRLKDGEEVEPTIHYKEANKVGCRVLPTNHLLNFGHDERLQMEIGASLRISESQVTELNNAFLSLIEKLQKSAEVALPIKSFTKHQSVLAYYSFGAGSGGEWCRANLTFDQCPKEDYVWVSFIDYGHKAMVPRRVIRVLEEALRREPVYLLTVSFNMPNENCQLRTVRKQIKNRDDETLVMLKVAYTVPKVFPQVPETLVVFSKAVQDHGKKGTYSITDIC